MHSIFCISVGIAIFIEKESRCTIEIVVTRVELSTEMDEYRDNQDTLVWLRAGGGGRKGTIPHVDNRNKKGERKRLI